MPGPPVHGIGSSAKVFVHQDARHRLAHWPAGMGALKLSLLHPYDFAPLCPCLAQNVSSGGVGAAGGLHYNERAQLTTRVLWRSYQHE